MSERTLVLLKPDAVARGLAGEIIARFERKGLRIAAMTLLLFDDELAAKHYAEHVGKYFYQRLRDFIVSGPSVAMVLEGDGAIEIVRHMMGATDPAEAAPAPSEATSPPPPRNLVHGSDSPKQRRERSRFFSRKAISSASVIARNALTRPRRRTRIVFAIAALVVVVVTWLLLPTPAWVRRNHVVDRDYRTMAYIFDADPLPDSFEIREVDYVGYSLVFNGPEGPAYSSYHIVMDARDFLPIRRLLQPFRQKDNRTYMWRPHLQF